MPIRPVEPGAGEDRLRGGLCLSVGHAQHDDLVGRAVGHEDVAVRRQRHLARGVQAGGDQLCLEARRNLGHRIRRPLHQTRRIAGRRGREGLRQVAGPDLAPDTGLVVLPAAEGVLSDEHVGHAGIGAAAGTRIRRAGEHRQGSQDRHSRHDRPMPLHHRDLLVMAGATPALHRPAGGAGTTGGEMG